MVFYLPVPKFSLYLLLTFPIFRLASSGIETRSLTPGTEIKDQNKRPAIICDFYAKGWCIKGSSCRFLHVKDHQNKELPRREGEVAADCKREVQLEGISCIF